MVKTDLSNCRLMLSDVELAELYGVKLSTIRKWRIRNLGPKWIKLGALVRYPLADAQAFIESQPAKGGEHVAA